MTKVCDEETYVVPTFSKFLRYWFAASAYISDQTQSFVIGKDWRGAPPAERELMCFANDSPKMYWNNWGRIRFSITRIT